MSRRIAKVESLLNDALKVHGLRVRPNSIDYQRGGHRLLDVCRWWATAQLLNGTTRFGLISISSWDTLTDCAQGLMIEIRPYRGEADIMVYATKK